MDMSNDLQDLIQQQPQLMHGSCWSHLSLDALHREQDSVSLRPPNTAPDEAAALASRLLVL